MKIALLALQSLTAIAGAYYSYLLIRIKQGVPEYTKLLASCDGGIWDCTKVNNSAYSEIFGMPTATYGFLFFLVMLALIAIQFTKLEVIKRGFARFALYLAAAGVVAGLTLAGISHFAIGAVCKYCFYTYIAEIILLVLVILYNRSEKITGDDLQKFLNNTDTGSKQILQFGYLPAVVLIGFIIYGAGSPADPHAGHNHSHQNQNPNQQVPEEYMQKVMAAYEEAPVQEFNLASTPSKGGANADITVVEFADFNCGHCGTMMRLLKSLEKTMGDNIKIYFKQFPLDGICNPHVKSKRKGSSCIAASAMICGQDRVWDMHDNIFFAQSQGMHTKARVDGLASKMGLNMAQYNACMKAPTTLAKIQADADEGQKAGVQATPTLYVNGKKAPSAISHPAVMVRFFSRLSAKLAVDKKKKK